MFLDNPDGSQYIGTVWPGYTVFPDWFTENAVAWWVNEMVRRARPICKLERLTPPGPMVP